MPKISTYTAGKLASQQVGVPPMDTGGAVIADTVSRIASGIASEIDTVLQRQKNLVQRAELTKKISQLDSDMAIASAEIRQANLSAPDEGVKELEAKRKELFEQYKESITDPEVKLQFDALGVESMVKGQALDRIWAFQENNRIIQKTHFDRIASDISFAGQTDNLNEVMDKAYMLERDRDNFYQAWGGVLEGSQVIDKAQEGLLKSYFYGQLSKGNAFKVLREIDDGKFGPTEEDKNGLILPQELKTLRDTAKQMALVGKDDGAAQALMDVVESNFNIDKALSGTIASTEEKINALSFEIAQKKKLVELGEVSEDEVKTLEQQQGVLEKVRAAQLSRSNMYVVPDEEVEADMTARFFSLFDFNKKGMKGPFKATLEEVFKFQQDLVNNRDKLSPSFVKKYSALVQAAFEAEIQGFKEGSKLKTHKSWFGLGPEVANDVTKLSGSKKLQNVFSNIISQHNSADGNKFLFETMQIFMDDLDERLDIKNTADLQMLPQSEMEELVRGAMRKMQLKKLGLPVYMGEKDVIYNSAGEAARIIGFNEKNLPIVEPIK